MNITSNQDTIAAIASAAGESAVAIVRLSGPKSLAIADRIFLCRGHKPSRRPPRTFVFGKVCDAEAGGQAGIIDEAVLLIFRAPHSFTRQDIVEFQCHGGHMAAQRIYRALLDQGARAAEAGEFTRRAFLNGRIDLVEAEAVIDIIKSQTLQASKIAAEQLSGSLSSVISMVYDEILNVLAEVDARLDFPDDEMPSFETNDWQPSLTRATSLAANLLATWERGRMMRQGAAVVIAGCTNAGKSTLMNALLGHDRAIVSPQPGTTRDSIEEGLQLNGIPIRLIDTAGYRETACGIEQHGMERADRLRRQADALIYMIDASDSFREMDRLNLAEAPQDRTLLVFNKTDLNCRIDGADYPDFKAVYTSLTETPEAVEDVKNALAELLVGKRNIPAPSVCIAERHRDLLLRTHKALEEAAGLLGNASPDAHVPIAIVLREALSALDECLGRSYSEALLDSIFSKFCIGK